MSNDQKVLWIGGYGPRSSTHGEGLATFRDFVESETNDEVRVEITWNIMDSGRPSTDLLELVEDGEMFFCYFSTSYLADRIPELNVLETPFLFEDLEAAHRAMDGPLGEALRRAVSSSSGFAALGFWDNGFRHFTNHRHPVRSPADCRGMTVRVQPNRIHEELIRSWGAIPVAVELNEGLRRLSGHEVDAQENPLANTVAYGVSKLHPYVTMTGHVYGARGLLAHRATFDSMPSDLQKTIEKAVASAVVDQREAAQELEKRLRTQMEQANTEFVDLTDRERELFVEAATPAIELARESAPAHLFELARV